jgi:hypothetical protein
MLLPPLLGNTINSDVVVFSAADEKYFNLYAKPLIASIKTHLTFPIHIHLYNPSSESIMWCNQNSVSVSYENLDIGTLEPSIQRWIPPQIDPESQRKKNGMIKDPKDIARLRSEVLKTYFACTRFIRLAELISKPTYIVMLDTDSIVRNGFVLPNSTVDVHIFEKRHKKHVPYTQHLASTIFYTGTNDSFKLIKEHARLIQQVYNQDELYWFLDQDTLDIAIQQVTKLPLDPALVDFDMKDTSPIWCAKGPRKFKDLYLNEIKKYSL